MKNKVAPIDKSKMDKVFDGSMTLKDMDSVMVVITDRCDYVVRKIFEIQGGKVDWWDFSNEGGKDGPSGYFDHNRYKNEVRFIGLFSGNWDKFYITDSFPTSWLWEDFESKLTQEIKDWKNKVAKEEEETKKKLVERENKKKELIASALAKLTPEEAKALGYRKSKV